MLRYFKHNETDMRHYKISQEYKISKTYGLFTRTLKIIVLHDDKLFYYIMTYEEKFVAMHYNDDMIL